MDYINQVTLAGLIADEPVGRVMGNGKPEYVATLACIDRWTDSTTGLPRARTDWFRIVIYGRLGDAASLVMKKGVAVWVQGRLRIRDLKNHHFVERHAAFVEVTRFDLVGGELASTEPQLNAGWSANSEPLAAVSAKADRPAFESDFGPLRSPLGATYHDDAQE